MKVKYGHYILNAMQKGRMIRPFSFIFIVIFSRGVFPGIKAFKGIDCASCDH